GPPEVAVARPKRPESGLATAVRARHDCRRPLACRTARTTPRPTTGEPMTDVAASPRPHAGPEPGILRAGLRNIRDMIKIEPARSSIAVAGAMVNTAMQMTVAFIVGWVVSRVAVPAFS